MWRWLHLFLLSPLAAATAASPLVDAAGPGMHLDIRYNSDNNFIGRPVDGYQAPRCLLTAQAAQALAEVQSEVGRFGLKLIIFDYAYS